MLDFDAIGKAIQALEFGTVFTVTEDGTVTTVSDVYAPEVFSSQTHDVEIVSNDWEALTGMTGQHGYKGAIMHPSEFIGAGIAKLLTESPGTFAVVVVNSLCECTPHVTRMSGFGTALYCETEQNAYCNFECECGADEEPAGWAILRHLGPATREEHAAAKLGTARGRAAASWVFDGNTSRETYAHFLRLSDDGDPALSDEFGPESGWLSGEWADDATPASLMAEIGAHSWDDEDAICEAYETAADEAYWAELERVARAQTSHPCGCPDDVVTGHTSAGRQCSKCGQTWQD